MPSCIEKTNLQGYLSHKYYFAVSINKVSGIFTIRVYTKTHEETQLPHTKPLQGGATAPR